jgi:hypothetical protein
MPHSKSFMYIRNSRGPRTDPCGTPDDDDDDDDDVELKIQ